MAKNQKAYNVKRPAVRMPKDVYEKFVDFCMVNDLVMSSTLGQFVEFCMEQAEFREVQAPTKKLFIGEIEV